jgi:DNA-binding NtrC family response regulator
MRAVDMSAPSGSTWKELRTNAARAAASASSCVLVVAPPGTPALELARTIHVLSPRAGEPFQHVDCVRERDVDLVVALRAAEAGTVLIERIELAERTQQAALAAALSGERATGMGHARVLATLPIAADKLPEARRLREDLLYRLNGLSLTIPPLRERRDELWELATTVLSREAPRLRFSAAARARLMAQDWPGNERELELAIARAALVCDSDTLEEHHLPIGAAASVTQGAEFCLTSRSLREVEAALIRRVLEEQGGNRSRAAAVLGLHRATLHQKLRALGLGPTRPS